jgi:Iap family predicted aminopeptidase
MGKKIFWLMAVLLRGQSFLFSQEPVDSIKESTVAITINILASDSMRGRGNGTPDILKAGLYIGNRFKEAGLSPLTGQTRYYMPFSLMGYNEVEVPDVANANVKATRGYNVVGMLPGKSRPKEIVIFSAHYDHVGISSRNKRDSIMNGANDNASGVTAVLMLADYFARQGNNERTILFCAFAGEELGLIGSKNFRNYLIPESIVAVINIEMIGIPQYGKDNFFITGNKYSDLPALLRKNMKGFNVKVKPEPNQNKLLFQRSDNFSFVLKRVPAHTIMSSDDDDPCYHKPCDEVNRVNFKHMTRVIRAIAFGTKNIIAGVETPTRTKPDDLR